MKYLGIHKAIWFAIVVIITAIDGILWLFGWILVVLWTFKVDIFKWSSIHSADEDYISSREPYLDNNILETVWRRYTTGYL